jgi:hypothetical protein
MLLEKWNNIIAFDYFPAAICRPQVRNKLIGRFHTYIITYQGLFKLIEKLFIDIPAESQYRRKGRTYPVSRLTKPFLKILDRFLEYTHKYPSVAKKAVIRKFRKNLSKIQAVIKFYYDNCYKKYHLLYFLPDNFL